MTIRENIQTLINKMLAEQAANGGNSATADDVVAKAKAAIFSGAKDADGNITKDWETYMKLFAGSPTNPQQLARLIPTDGTDANADMQNARAYLVANGMLCGGETTDTLDNNVTSKFQI